MFRTKTFFGLLATIVVVGAVAGGWLQKKGVQEFRPGLAVEEGSAPRPQSTGERTWRERPSRKVYTVGADQPVFFGPLRAKVSPDGRLFVVDYGDFKVKEISPEGAVVQTYGNGKGQGPGEFSSLNDMAASDGETVWVSDFSNGRITIFGRDGAILRTLRMTQQPYRIAPLSGDGFAMMLPPGSSQLFGLYDTAGKQKRSFGRYIEDQAVNSILLDGWLEPDRDGGFAFAGLHASFLVAYDGQGNRRFLVETIAPKPLPKLQENSEGVRWVDREATPSSFSLSIADGKAHVLSYMDSGLKRIGVVDSYDLKDGSYLFSRRLPETCQWVVVAEDAMYTVTETTASKWVLEL